VALPRAMANEQKKYSVVNLPLSQASDNSYKIKWCWLEKFACRNIGYCIEITQVFHTISPTWTSVVCRVSTLSREKDAAPALNRKLGTCFSR